jgi:drug/metabolite transporter (DMT)-like permease
MKWILVMVIVACNATGDLLNSFGMRQQPPVHDFHPSGLRRLLRSILHNRYVIGGVCAMAIAFFALLSLLSIADLSFAVPATAASFLLETILAEVILKEEVHWQRWLGAIMVAAGVGLLALQ